MGVVKNNNEGLVTGDEFQGDIEFCARSSSSSHEMRDESR